VRGELQRDAFREPEFAKERRRKENGIAFACCSVALSDLEVEA
jgi:hypothetical protein